MYDIAVINLLDCYRVQIFTHIYLSLFDGSWSLFLSNCAKLLWAYHSFSRFMCAKMVILMFICVKAYIVSADIVGCVIGGHSLFKFFFLENNDNLKKIRSTLLLYQKGDPIWTKILESLSIWQLPKNSFSLLSVVSCRRAIRPWIGFKPCYKKNLRQLWVSKNSNSYHMSKKCFYRAKRCVLFLQENLYNSLGHPLYGCIQTLHKYIINSLNIRCFHFSHFILLFHFFPLAFKFCYRKKIFDAFLFCISYEKWKNWTEINPINMPKNVPLQNCSIFCCCCCFCLVVLFFLIFHFILNMLYIYFSDSFMCM